MPSVDYRTRIYQSYVSAGPQVLAPKTVEGLEPRRAHLEKLIRDHFPPDRDAAIIELGCGHGAVVHFARNAGYRNVVGVDRSAEQVALAAALGIDGVREGDLMETLRALADESYESVVAIDVIEHFTKDELLALVDEVLRVLKPGGRWIMHAPNGESPFFGRMRYGEFTHELAFTRESLEQLLLPSGFSEVRFFEDGPVPQGLKSGVRWLLWKLIRGVLRFYLAVEFGTGGRDVIVSQILFAVGVK